MPDLDAVALHRSLRAALGGPIAQESTEGFRKRG
jgi:hypothetical protein